jgi:hypothetical protein
MMNRSTTCVSARHYASHVVVEWQNDAQGVWLVGSSVAGEVLRDVTLLGSGVALDMHTSSTTSANLSSISALKAPLADR